MINQKTLKKRVLIISQYYPPDITAAAFRINDMVNALKKCGFDVKVITSRPHKATMQYEDTLGDEHFVARLWVPKGMHGLIGQINNYLSFAMLAVIKGVFTKGKFDWVIVSSPPLFLSITGYVLSRIKRAKYLADVRDIWPDSVVAARVLEEGSKIHKVFLGVEKWFYRQADYITCVSKPMSDYITKKSGKKVEVIYNGVSSDIIEASLMPASKRGTVFNITYFGNVGRVQGLGTIIDALALLQSEGAASIRFTLVGDGVQKSRLINKANELKIDNIEFVGAVPRNEIKDYVKDADVLFLALDDHPSLEKTIPSKLFDYLLFNKPIIAGIRGEGKEIIEKLGCGIVYHPNDVNQLVGGIKEIILHYDEFNGKARYNRDYVVKNFHREEGFVSFFSNYLTS